MRRLGRDEAAVGRDHEHAARRREARRVGELAAEVERREEAEDLAERRAVAAHALGERERRIRPEQQLAALSRAARGRQQEHGTRHPTNVAQHPRAATAVDSADAAAREPAPLADARQARRRAARRARAGSSSRSGTAFACSSSATATSCCCRAATRSRSTATSPSCASRSSPQLPARCVLDGELVIARDGGARLRGAAAAHPSGRVAREAARERDPRVDRVLGPALRRRPRPARAAVPRAPRRARALLATRSRRCT